VVLGGLLVASQKVGMACSIQNRGLLFSFDLLVPIFLIPFLPLGGFVFVSRLVGEPCGPADLIFHLMGII
jgi:hypothetical protein